MSLHLADNRIRAKRGGEIDVRVQTSRNDVLSACGLCQDGCKVMPAFLKRRDGDES